MLIKIGSLRAGGRTQYDKRWDNVVEFADFAPTVSQWRSLRLLISRCGGRIACLDPVRIVILDCFKRGSNSQEVKTLLSKVKELRQQWEAEEYESQGKRDTRRRRDQADG